MKFKSVTIQVRNPEVYADFYEGILGLRTHRSTEAATIHVGATLLVATRNPAGHGSEHLAITIPSNKFQAAKKWLSSRATILASAETDEFECAPSWNARSVYFAGPEDSVLELIIRRGLGNATPGAFTSYDLLNISEVGIAVDDVIGTAAFLDAEAGIQSYGVVPGESFAALGDADGLIILVTPERPWFPTSARRAGPTATTITAFGPRPGTYPVGAHAVLLSVLLR